MFAAEDGLHRAVELLHVDEGVDEKPLRLGGHVTRMAGRAPKQKVGLTRKGDAVVALHIETTGDDFRILGLEQMFGADNHARDPGHLLMDEPRAHGPAGFRINLVDERGAHGQRALEHRVVGAHRVQAGVEAGAEPVELGAAHL